MTLKRWDRNASNVRSSSKNWKLSQRTPRAWIVFKNTFEGIFCESFVFLEGTTCEALRWGVGGRLQKSKKTPWAGWPRCFALVWATLRAEVDVMGAQLCSCTRAIFSWVTLSWSDGSLPLIIVGNSPNMHNTGFFPDCHLLSLTDGSIWIPYLARYSEIFKKSDFQVVKWKSTFIWKTLSRWNWKPKDHVWLQYLVCLPPLVAVPSQFVKRVIVWDNEMGSCKENTAYSLNNTTSKPWPHATCPRTSDITSSVERFVVRGSCPATSKLHLHFDNWFNFNKD